MLTHTVFLTVTIDVLLNLEATMRTFCSCLDLLAAFRTLDQELLLSILEASFNITDKKLALMNVFGVVDH